MDFSEKNIPVMHAVMRHARVAATRALNPIAAISFFLEGAKAASPPTKMAIEAICANPHNA